MTAAVTAAPLAGADAFDSQSWERRHRVLGGLVLAALSVRLRLNSDPAYADIALLGGLAGLVGGRRMRRVAAAALRALGTNPTRDATRRFVWNWWYQRAACGVQAYQADRVTPARAERHVAVSAPPPVGGCILVSVHDFNQRLAFARLSTLVDNLGGIGLFEPLAHNDPSLSMRRFALDAAAQARARSRFCHQVFGPRVFPPRTAPRRGLELLQRGGSMIVLADFFGREPVCLLGKQWYVPAGPLWWAEQSGRPIVPFAIAPLPGERQRWQLWCGEPIDATPTALGNAIEACIRRAPTGWTGWSAWAEAPGCAS